MSPPASPKSQTKQEDAVKLKVSGKDASSLKRVREGSTEPSSSADVAPPVVPVVTKKNRVAPPTEGESLSRKTSLEGQTVGEVRKKVEEMNWKGDEAKKKANGHINQPINVDEVDESAAAEEGAEEKEASAEDEDVDLAPAEHEAGEVSPTSETSHKRKQIDRHDSSLDAVVDGTKRPKEDELEAEEATTEPSSTPTESRDKPGAESPPVVAAAPIKKPQTTFSSFSSSASPFSAGLKHTSVLGSATQPIASSSSSPKPSAFGGYSSAFSAFAAKDKKQKGEEDQAEGSKSSFGDILADQQEDKGKDKNDKLQMTTQDVPTGEEDEETVHQTRVKLHVMEKDGGWKERGTGNLRLNVRKSDGKGARLVMRAEGVLRLVLNVPLFVGMSCSEEGKHVRMTVIEDGEIRNLAFRTNSAKVASELYNQIHDLIPLESAGSKSPQPAGDPAAGGWDAV